MCIGEISQQNIIKKKSNLEIEEYIEILKYKTGYLMSCCCESGAIISHQNINTINHLKQFGLYYGIAYQLIDDYIDMDTGIKTEKIITKAKYFIKKAMLNISKLDTHSGTVYFQYLCSKLLKLI